MPIFVKILLKIKIDIKTHDRSYDSNSRVTYTPQEPGIYLINVKFNDEHVPGSPFTVKAVDSTCDDDQVNEEIPLANEECSAVALNDVTEDITPSDAPSGHFLKLLPAF